MTDPYENLATLYDIAGWGDFAQGMAERVLALAADHGLSEIHHIVDVACGTGIAAAQFAQAGYCVTGVDRSPHMLAQARQRVAEAGLQPKVTFVEADMRDFALDQARDGLRIVGLAEDGARFYARSQTAAATRLGHDFSVPVQKDVWHGLDKAAQTVIDLERIALRKLEQVQKKGDELADLPWDEAAFEAWTKMDEEAERLVEMSYE